MTTTDEILNQALGLPSSERALLAHHLLANLDADYCDPDWEAAWRAEIERRLDDIDNGKEAMMDCHEALASIRTSLQTPFRELPDEPTSEEILDELAIMAAIRQGRADIGAGRFLTHDEMKKSVTSPLRQQGRLNR